MFVIGGTFMLKYVRRNEIRIRSQVGHAYGSFASWRKLEKILNSLLVLEQPWA